MDHQAEFERLFRLDYGNLAEFGFRFAAIIFAGASFYIYSGWLIVWLWILAYATGHLALYSFLRARRRNCTPKDLTIAGILLTWTLACFLSLPTYLIIQTDDVMQTGGFGAIIITIVIMIRRSDTQLFVILTEIAFVAALTLTTLADVLPLASEPSAKLTLIVIGGALVAYFAESLITARAQRLALASRHSRDLQAQKMEVLGRVAGGVAHDFNNLLTVIVGNLDLHDESTDPQDKKLCLNNARTAVNQAALHVEQLLDYSRRSHTELDLTRLNVVLQDAAMASRQLLPTSVPLIVPSGVHDAWIRVDSSKFVSAFMNLVTNARDALGPDGKIIVTCETSDMTVGMVLDDTTSLPPGPYAQVAVVDNGSGMASDLIGKVRDPFFTTKLPGKGTGLGLPMVDGFCRSMGGALMLDSSRQGTTATMILPIADPPAEFFDLHGQGPVSV